jgi:hypothetical protein
MPQPLLVNKKAGELDANKILMPANASIDILQKGYGTYCPAVLVTRKGSLLRLNGLYRQ